ncbi:MAG: PAS domain S-box protein [Phycisphaerales bacterium]|nr:MAG: PAS domain S-box protein [Phycisphaerales bacterium]
MIEPAVAPTGFAQPPEPAHAEASAFPPGIHGFLDGGSYLAAIVDSSDDAIVGTSLDGTVRSWNRGAERLYGFRRDEMMGRSIHRIVPDDRRGELERIRESLRRGERVDSFETVRMRRDGQPVCVSLSVSRIVGPAGQVLGAAFIERDITGRRRELSAANSLLRHETVERRRIESLLATENRLLELIATGAGLEELLQALCQAVESLVPGSRCAIRLASGRTRVPANALPEPLGSVTVGLDAFGPMAEEGVSPPLCPRRIVVADAESCLDADIRSRGVRSCWFEPVSGAGGTLVGTLGVYRSVPTRPDEDALAAGALAARLTAIVVERARADERAREQLAQLAHVARLATMGEMASGLAHELNQPLCAIVNFTEACVELVHRNGDHVDQIAQALSEVSRQAERAGQVIRRLREFVKRREPVRQSVDINRVVRDVVAFTGVEVRQCDVRVRVKLARRVPPVFADSIQIEQVLVNLVRNACEAMREGEAAGKGLMIETLRRKGAVEVAVSDGGPGIPPQMQERLFEPFFTTKRDGLGMGLSISRSILEAHEGRIWATSNRKGGTTIHFTLPTAWRASRGRRHRVRCR